MKLRIEAAAPLSTSICNRTSWICSWIFTAGTESPDLQDSGFLFCPTSKMDLRNSSSGILIRVTYMLFFHQPFQWRFHIRDLKIQDGREDDGAPKEGKDWA